jgi:hypothetical protein
MINMALAFGGDANANVEQKAHIKRACYLEEKLHLAVARADTNTFL